MKNMKEFIKSALLGVAIFGAMMAIAFGVCTLEAKMTKTLGTMVNVTAVVSMSSPMPATERMVETTIITSARSAEK